MKAYQVGRPNPNIGVASHARPLTHQPIRLGSVSSVGVGMPAFKTYAEAIKYGMEKRGWSKQEFAHNVHKANPKEVYDWLEGKSYPTRRQLPYIEGCFKFLKSCKHLLPAELRNGDTPDRPPGGDDGMDKAQASLDKLIDMAKKTTREYGAAITASRYRVGMDVKQYAAKLGVPIEELLRWEAGRGLPSGTAWETMVALDEERLKRVTAPTDAQREALRRALDIEHKMKNGVSMPQAAAQAFGKADLLTHAPRVVIEKIAEAEHVAAMKARAPHCSGTCPDVEQCATTGRCLVLWDKPKTFGAALQKALDKRKLNDRMAASQMSVSARSIQNWREGKSVMPVFLGQLIKLWPELADAPPPPAPLRNFKTIPGRKSGAGRPDASGIIEPTVPASAPAPAPAAAPRPPVQVTLPTPAKPAMTLQDASNEWALQRTKVNAIKKQIKAMEEALLEAELAEEAARKMMDKIADAQ